MIKEYPERKNNKLYSVCECGHMWADHGLQWFSFIGNSRCEKCQCPKYHFEKKATMDEIVFSEYDRKGFTWHKTLPDYLEYQKSVAKEK